MHESVSTEALRLRVRLRRTAWDEHVKAKGLRTNAECAQLLGTSESTIWRVKADDVEPSSGFIAAALWRLPNTTFEELFEVVCVKAAAR